MLPDLYTKKTFFTASGSAMAVWLFTTVLSNAFQFDTDKYKWIGLIVALIVSFMGARSTQKPMDVTLSTIAFFNGLLIYITASGIDAVNQGVDVGKTKTEQTAHATLIPFTKKSTWWPTQSLVDSVEQEVERNEVLTADNERLTKEFNEVRDSCFNETFDKVVPIILPHSSVVAAGGKYEADLFLVASDSKQKLDMYASGKQLPVQVDPETGLMVGKISFTATAPDFDANGRAKRTLMTEVKLKEMTYKRAVDYTVVKPVIRVTTGGVPTLYMNCGNAVNIEVPALGLDYNPTFTAKGARIEKGSRPGRIVIIPTERRVTVTVSNAGMVLGSEIFDVKPIPRPRYVAYDNSGGPLDLKNGIRGAALTGLKVIAEADENFRTELPQDGIFRIKSMEIVLARGTQRVGTSIEVTTELIDLSTWRSQLKPGDRIIVDIKTVVRKTYSGEEEKVDIVGGTITIPIQ